MKKARITLDVIEDYGMILHWYKWYKVNQELKEYQQYWYDYEEERNITVKADRRSRALAR